MQNDHADPFLARTAHTNKRSDRGYRVGSPPGGTGLSAVNLISSRVHVAETDTHTFRQAWKQFISFLIRFDGFIDIFHWLAVAAVGIGAAANEAAAASGQLQTQSPLLAALCTGWTGACLIFRLTFL